MARRARSSRLCTGVLSALVNEGIYFIPEPGTDGKSSIQFLSFATAKVKTVAPISGSPTEGLSVSPDGRSILFSQLDERRQRPDAGGKLSLSDEWRVTSDELSDQPSVSEGKRPAGWKWRDSPS